MMSCHEVYALTSVRPSPVRPARESKIEEESGLRPTRRRKPVDGIATDNPKNVTCRKCLIQIPKRECQ